MYLKRQSVYYNGIAASHVCVHIVRIFLGNSTVYVCARARSHHRRGVFTQNYVIILYIKRLARTTYIFKKRSLARARSRPQKHCSSILYIYIGIWIDVYPVIWFCPAKEYKK